MFPDTNLILFMGDWLKNKTGFAGALRWLMGGVLVALGLRLVFSDRR